MFSVTWVYLSYGDLRNMIDAWFSFVWCFFLEGVIYLMKKTWCKVLWVQTSKGSY